MHKRKRPLTDSSVQLLLTIPQVAAMLGCGRTTVYDLIKREGLPSVSLGERGLRVVKASLEQWIREREVRPGV